MSFIEKYKNSSVYMVSGLDSLGVPYTLDNELHKSFVDLVADEFKKNGINIEYVNLHCLARNKTWELKKILDKDYTKEKYYKINKKLNKMVIDNSKNKDSRFDHPINQEFINVYYENPTNPEKRITTSLKEENNPIFLYSCGGMNFDYYAKMPSCDIRKILPQVTIHLIDNIKKTKNDIEECIKFIARLNPNIEVYVLGVYSMVDNKFVRFIAEPLYNLYNTEIKKICLKYNNVHFVDVSGTKKYIAYHDNHPTYEGQKYMSKQIIKTMQKRNES